MTLVEVMVASTIFVTSAVGLAQTFIAAYRMAALTRYSDASKNVLQVFVAQFHRLEYLWDPDGDGPAPVEIRPLFTTTKDEAGEIVETDAGLSINQNGNVIDNGVVQLQSGTGNYITARVTRKVYRVDATTGTFSTSETPTVAGMLLEGQFIIRFEFRGKTYTQEISTIRNVP